jgi:hypothetical protein
MPIQWGTALQTSVHLVLLKLERKERSLPGTGVDTSHSEHPQSIMDDNFNNIQAPSKSSNLFYDPQGRSIQSSLSLRTADAASPFLSRVVDDMEASFPDKEYVAIAEVNFAFPLSDNELKH